MNNLEGIAYLRMKLSQKQGRVRTRYDYYEMKEHKQLRSVVIPPQLKYSYPSTLGWCTKAVDFLADRLVVKGFENDNFNMQQIYNLNNPDVLFDSAVLSALIASCSFISISADADGFPRLEVIDAYNATGIIDPITGMLKEGYAVLQRDKVGQPVIEAYYTPNYTDYYYTGVDKPQRIANPAPYPLLVPIINRPDAVRPFGHSRISRACMDIQDKARGTITRAEITSEFYSFPQKYILGLQEGDEFDTVRASISSFLTLYEADGDTRPTVGQFQQSSTEPFMNQMRQFASLFCGETGLSMDDIGFVSQNPSSAEAIRASHESLRNTARRAQRDFGSGFVNAGYLAACMRDDMPYKRTEVYQTSVVWQPIIEPDTASMSQVGDAAIKINQAIPGYFGRNNLEQLIGVKGDD